MKNQNEIREDFERNYLGGNKQNARRNDVGDYVLPSIQDAWSGYKAGKEEAYLEYENDTKK